MKTILRVLGALLVLDLLFVSYFHIFRAGYYFPDRYEDAVVADFYAVVFGLPIFAAFVTVLALHLRRHGKTQV